MEKKAHDNQLTFDLTIRYRGRVYNLTLGRVLRWLVPVALVICRLVSQVHSQAS